MRFDAPFKYARAKRSHPTDTKSGLNTPLLRKQGQLLEAGEAGGEKSFSWKEGL
jgi:hypothetical protein